jgi:hypothetical protein
MMNLPSINMKLYKPINRIRGASIAKTKPFIESKLFPLPVWVLIVANIDTLETGVNTVVGPIVDTEDDLELGTTVACVGFGVVATALFRHRT